METTLLIVLVAIWIGFALLAASYGEKRNFGYAPTLIVSLIFSPLLGFLIAAITAPKAKPEKKKPEWKKHRERGDKAAYKNKSLEAVDAYQDSMYHLENDYPKLSVKEETRRISEIAELQRKIDALK